MRAKNGYRWYKQSEHWDKRSGRLYGSGHWMHRYFLLRTPRRNKWLEEDVKSAFDDTDESHRIATLYA